MKYIMNDIHNNEIYNELHEILTPIPPRLTVRLRRRCTRPVYNECRTSPSSLTIWVTPTSSEEDICPVRLPPAVTRN